MHLSVLGGSKSLASGWRWMREIALLDFYSSHPWRWGRGLFRSICRDHPRSKWSRFMTLFHASMKSWTNFFRASALPYPSDIARSCASEPNTRLARVPLHLTFPVVLSRPSNTSFASYVAIHTVPVSSRLTKKSLVYEGI